MLSLLQHYIQVHNLEVSAEMNKKYECEQCRELFLRPGQLQAHLRKHTGRQNKHTLEEGDTTTTF